ncbi:MAG: hypothetical protein QM775_26170 [Pirellulales bacterium]
MKAVKCLLLVGVLTFGPEIGRTHVAGAAHPAVVDKELMITDLAVVNHAVEALKPDGAFHVHTLLEAMAPSGGSAKDVLLSFIRGLRTAKPDLPATTSTRS